MESAQLIEWATQEWNYTADCSVDFDTTLTTVFDHVYEWFSIQKMQFAGVDNVNAYIWLRTLARNGNVM